MDLETQEFSNDRRYDSQRQPVAPPVIVPGYEPGRFLGSGAYGEVWVATDTTTGRKVAMKFFARRDQVEGASLTREVEKLVALSADRYVVQLLDVGWDADPPYYVMEYIANGSLEDHLCNGRVFSVNEAVEVFRDIAIGLSHAHGKGIIHCDIKPANVLLDQDDKPRLADFGQARLMYEQDPTLGTLYYMAPEQADIRAMPDARWDVYALGAVLYAMLTGTPPHRTDERIEELQSADALEERLRRYREQLYRLPRPNLHRRRHGVDRSLCEIVDGCLAADPNERFQTVNGVLNALGDRDRARARQPLVLLGLVGPLLLMLTMGVFGYRGYLRAMRESTELAKQGTTDSNLWAAESTAKLVAQELDKRFAALDLVATEEAFLGYLKQALQDAEIAAALDQLAEPPSAAETMAQLRRTLLDHPNRRDLQKYIQALLVDDRLPYAASWFVTSARGTMLAAGFHTPPPEDDVPVGRNYSYRTYFHGGPRDLEPSRRAGQPIQQSHLSALFRSTATKTWKVAVSRPLRLGDQLAGVLAMTVELGDFVRFSSSADRCALLVDAREGNYRGVVLQHPLFNRVLRERKQLPQRFADRVVDVDQLQAKNGIEYTDPFAGDELGSEYRGTWIASSAPVTIERLLRDGPNGDDVRKTERKTGLLLIVQQRLEQATQPVTSLGRRLLREALAALAIVLLVTSLLWVFVVQMVRGARGVERLRQLHGNTLESLHSRETMDSREPR